MMMKKDNAIRAKWGWQGIRRAGGVSFKAAPPLFDTSSEESKREIYAHIRFHSTYYTYPLAR